MQTSLPPLVVVFAVVLAAACSPLAPPPTEGKGANESCASSWECAAGLGCECGLCVQPTGLPLLCIPVGDECTDPPSPCYEECGDLDVVGQAECVDGRESCRASGGVLETQCAPDTCWGEPQPGESCMNGVLECTFGRSTSTGLCYTFDCTDTAGSCLNQCGGTFLAAEVCLASELRCETGVSESQCGECVGAPPQCFSSCTTLEPVGTAVCAQSTLTWSCSHILVGSDPAEVASDCCVEDPIVVDQASHDALIGASCVLGSLQISSSSLTQVVLPALRVVDNLYISENPTLERVLLPALTDVSAFLWVESNPILAELSAPSLERVGTAFDIGANPLLPTCEIFDLLAQVEAVNDVPFVWIDGNAECADGGVAPDAGDAGGAGDDDGGPDGGDDAGIADAG